MESKNENTDQDEADRDQADPTDGQGIVSRWGAALEGGDLTLSSVLVRLVGR